MIRKASLLVVISLMLLVGVSCATAAGTTETQQQPLLEKPVELDNTITASVETITAKVEILPSGETSLVENWDSKSRKTYSVVGDLAVILQKFNDRIITADVVFLEKKTWSGSLVIVTFNLVDNGTAPTK